MKKLSLALIGLAVASITTANAQPSVAIANYTNCPATFYGINNDWAKSIINQDDLDPGFSGILDLIEGPISGNGFSVKAAPAGTFQFFGMSYACSNSPSVAILVCEHSHNGKCDTVRLQCYQTCPGCVIPPAPPVPPASTKK